MAYLRLLWMYYDTEGPLSDDHESLAFQIGADPQNVRLILDHFFQLDANALRTHKKCEEVLSDYRSKADLARKSANARWKNANALRTQSERIANAPKIDANQEPITNIKKEDLKEGADGASPGVCGSGRQISVAQLQALGVDKQIATEYLQLRKRKKANLTPVALEGVRREAANAGISLCDAMRSCVENGWQGFKAEWVQNRQRAGPKSIHEIRAATNAALTGRDKAEEKNGRTIDITPDNRSARGVD
jgi:uncharacterized protein YdaU (DUF1376 family)